MHRSVLLVACLVVGCSAPASRGAEAPKKTAAVDQAETTPADNKGEAPAATDEREDKADDDAKHDAPAEAVAKAEVGKPAPDFSLTALDGTTHSLSQYAGKLVVLEWFNPECPFVNYAHTEGPLVKLAAEQTEAGVVWLAINSGGPGKQGHGPEANEAGVEKFAMTHPVLFDESGEIGHAYGAVKTPHLFVIDTKGVLRYAGGVDNAPFGEVDGGGDKRNHLLEALADVRAGKDVRVPTAPAWGCTVKYAS